MTAVETAVRDRIVTTEPAKTKVGSRVHPLVLPQTPTLPAVVYRRISIDPTHSHDGASDLDRSRVQVDAWADTYAEAREAAVAIRVTLDGQRGMWSGLWVSGVLLDGGDDHYEDEVAMWRARMDYRIWHATEVP